MAKALTEITVENAKPGKNKETGAIERTEVRDGGCKGLYLVVQPSGAKSWAVRYRFVGTPRKLTLGPALVLDKGEREPGDPTINDALTLAAARKLATDALHQLKKGVDPAKGKQDARRTSDAAAAARAEDSVENLADQFIERYAKVKNRSWTQTKAIFDKKVIPEWKGKTVHEITQDDVEHLVHKIEERDGPIAANRALAAVRKWFAWMGGRHKGGKRAILKTRLKTAPCVGIEPPGTETRRDRVLTVDEIKALWGACDGIGEPFGPFIKMLLLTGQRRSEVSEMRWSEIDADKGIWTIPTERTKNKLAHVVPLSTQARETIEAVQRIEKADHVFTTTGDSGIGGFSRAKERVDKLTKVKPWTFHDLRRTAATGMAEIGIKPHIIEAVLNHISGTAKAGVAGVYNRWAYHPEKADALQRWADHVDKLVTGKPVGKVIRPRFGRRR